MLKFVRSLGRWLPRRWSLARPVASALAAPLRRRVGVGVALGGLALATSFPLCCWYLDHRKPHFMRKAMAVQNESTSLFERSSEKKKLATALCLPEPRPCVLLGPAGCGKSTLAQHVLCSEPNRIFISIGEGEGNLLRALQTLPLPALPSGLAQLERIIRRTLLAVSGPVDSVKKGLAMVATALANTDGTPVIATGTSKLPVLCIDGVEKLSSEDAKLLLSWANELAEQKAARLLLVMTDEAFLANHSLMPKSWIIRMAHLRDNGEAAAYLAYLLRDTPPFAPVGGADPDYDPDCECEKKANETAHAEVHRALGAVARRLGRHIGDLNEFASRARSLQPSQYCGVVDEMVSERGSRLRALFEPCAAQLPQPNGDEFAASPAEQQSQGQGMGRALWSRLFKLLTQTVFGVTSEGDGQVHTQPHQQPHQHQPHMPPPAFAAVSAATDPADSSLARWLRERMPVCLDPTRKHTCTDECDSALATILTSPDVVAALEAADVWSLLTMINLSKEPHHRVLLSDLSLVRALSSSFAALLVPVHVPAAACSHENVYREVVAGHCDSLQPALCLDLPAVKCDGCDPAQPTQKPVVVSEAVGGRATVLSVAAAAEPAAPVPASPASPFPASPASPFLGPATAAAAQAAAPASRFSFQPFPNSPARFRIADATAQRLRDPTLLSPAARFLLESLRNGTLEWESQQQLSTPSELTVAAFDKFLFGDRCLRAKLSALMEFHFYLIRLCELHDDQQEANREGKVLNEVVQRLNALKPQLSEVQFSDAVLRLRYHQDLARLRETELARRARFLADDAHKLHSKARMADALACELPRAGQDNERKGEREGGVQSEQSAAAGR